MVNVNVSLPEEILLTLREDKEQFVKEMKQTIALKYYKDRKLSIGQCAVLADMAEEDFILYIGKQGISIFEFESEDELLEDINNA